MPTQKERLYCSGWDPLMSQLEGGRPLGARMMYAAFLRPGLADLETSTATLDIFFSTITITVTLFFNEKIRVCFTTASALSTKKGRRDDRCICANGTFSFAMKAEHMSREPACTYRGGVNGQSIIWSGLSFSLRF